LRVPETSGVSWQLPLPALSVAVQAAPALSLILTDPVGVPENAGDTVTLTVTAWPTADGFVDEVIAVVLFAFPTEIEPLAGEVLPV
jgi:hypothetical protein